MVRLDQPYRNYAVDLLTPQHYPKDGAAPYDDVSWELPAHYHLQAIPTADASIRDVAVDCGYGDSACRGACQRRRAGLLAEGHGPGIFSRGALSAGRFRNSKLRSASSRSVARSFLRDRGLLRISTGCATQLRRHSEELGLDFTEVATHDPMCRITSRKRRALACGCRGPIRTRSAGSVIRSISAKFLIRICATRIFVRGICASRIDVLLYGHVDLELAEQIEGHAENLVAHAFQEDGADTELRNSRGIGRHHRRDRL